MSKGTEVHVHIHVHEGASPEAVRAGAEGLTAHIKTGPAPSEGGPAAADNRSELVRRAYRDSEEKAKPLLEYLADNPERLIPYPEMSRHLSFPTSRSLPGLLGAFTRRADHRYGGVQPFEKRDTLDGWCLYMSQANADIINEVRRQEEGR